MQRDLFGRAYGELSLAASWQVSISGVHRTSFIVTKMKSILNTGQLAYGAQLAVWCSGNAICRINKVTLWRAQLVLWWVCNTSLIYNSAPPLNCAPLLYDLHRPSLPIYSDTKKIWWPVPSCLFRSWHRTWISRLWKDLGPVFPQQINLPLI